MDFEYSPKVSALRQQVREFIDTHIEPNEHEFEQQLAKSPWETPEIVQRLKVEARKQGLWNLFLPPVYGKYSAGLTNAEYAPNARPLCVHAACKQDEGQSHDAERLSQPWIVEVYPAGAVRSGQHADTQKEQKRRNAHSPKRLAGDDAQE